MYSLWLGFRGGGMGGSTILPNDMMEQPCIMLTAFNIMSATQASLEDKDGTPLNEDGEPDYAFKESKAASSWGVMV